MPRKKADSTNEKNEKIGSGYVVCNMTLFGKLCCLIGPKMERGVPANGILLLARDDLAEAHPAIFATEKLAQLAVERTVAYFTAKYPDRPECEYKIFSEAAYAEAVNSRTKRKH